ncbi:hypothetical protein Lesp02_01960 [Lentzea sp. NBRC 105346]|uniref:hypothetical protein n=1 Tax=Lentzea sp. NBRC 105346 TaxID=3032205 RepID=UPI0024A0E24C|nr:hypothetical protein [Lentzea sp. NBRC 105346]GLZ28006.1 hypothetical protein Lesp02_01960 [Lentzea sp. NBRC 105346]
MTDPRRDDVVEQAFFGVSHENKHTLIAYSFEGPAVNRWRARLSDLTRLQPDGAGTVPPSAMSYLTFENEGDDRSVAIVRRVNVGHSAGRGNAHVLIGSPAALDVTLALALDTWSEWRVTPPSTGVGMGTISARYLAGATVQPNWPSLISEVEDQLVEVLARLLDNPAMPLSVIGCPDSHRLAMVWGLREAADGYLRRAGRNLRWSFSTYEDRHDDSVRSLPEIVFLSGIPGRGVASRTVVDLRREPEDSPSRPLACQLVDTVLRGGPAPNFDSTPTRRQHPVAPAPRPQPIVPATQHVMAARDDKGGYAAPDLGSAWVNKLLSAGSVDELLGYLAELAKVSAAERQQLRAAMDVRALDKIADIVEVRATGEMLQGLLLALYGRGLEDLHQADGALKHAEDLVNGTRSEHLAMMMTVSAWDRGRDISTSVVKRWADGGRPPRRIKLRRPRRTLKRVLRTWILSVGIAVAVLGLLGSGFWFGLATGQPESPQQPTTTPATAAPAQPPPIAPQPIAGTASLNSAPAEGQQVYGFVRIKRQPQLYYPQMSCLAADERHVKWRCAATVDPKAMDGELVAVIVPAEDVRGLDRTANTNNFVYSNTSWNKPIVVSLG